jgi:hypothetical protein
MTDAQHDHSRQRVGECRAGRGQRDLPQAAADNEQAGRWQDPHAGLQRGIAKVELQELGQHEQRAIQAERGQPDGGDCRRERAVAEELQVQHRVQGDPLPPRERGEHHHSGRPCSDDQAGGPAAHRRLDDCP